MFQHVHLFQKTPIRVEEIDGGQQRTLPELFEPGGGMRRFIVAPDLGYRAGFTKVLGGQGFKTFFWYDEFWVTIEGTARVTAIDRPTNTTIQEVLRPHEYVYIPAGTHISLETSNDQSHFLFTYIAIPASNKHAAWLSSMTPEDIEDIRIRGEHTKAGFEAEMQRSGQPMRV